MPEALVPWAGQALMGSFPDGLLSGAARNGLQKLEGWPNAKRPADFEGLRKLLESLGAREIRFSRLQAKNWVKDYRARFPEQHIGPFVLLPEWRKPKKLSKGRFLIRLLPGQAFGTGLHSSTRLMLRALAKENLKGLLLDLGAGSGILGLAALRLGAKKIVAIEIERAAAAELRGNRKLNGIRVRALEVIAGSFPEALRGRRLKADLVLANLVTPLLVKEMGLIAARVKEGGRLLVSGIFGYSEAVLVQKAMSKAGLSYRGQQVERNWYCLAAER